MDGWWDDEVERQSPVAVPHGELSAEALRGVIESFVLREGTDYGERDVPFDTKVAQVMDFARRHQHPLQCTMEKE